MSCMEDPQTFLTQLRDHNLVPEDLYKKVIKMKNKERKQNGVYEILDWVENNREQCMKLFWSCVFQDHILRKYPVLRLLQKSLLDGSFRNHENLLNAEKKHRNKDAEGGEKKQHNTGATKRKRSAEETDDEETSSVSSQKKPAIKPDIYMSGKSVTVE
ncbi:nuclear body protein [Clarias magur]|uniref:Nuclear body protein n=1 Tax=Clarias magur TaxID=1594786 RepID=A0A8J4UFS6_CLAMG|nr:nuclear body protein [Clarias magur]